MQLFRSEAMRGQDRLHGEVVLVPPVSWQLFGGFIFAAVLVALLFLLVGEYGKVTSVDGRIVAGGGVSRAVAPRSGTIEAVLVREGQLVAAGTPLVRISVATRAGGESLQERRAEAIARQDRILARRVPNASEAFRARVGALTAQIEGDRAEMASLDAQLREQSELVRTAAEELELARSVAARGYVSRMDVRRREELLGTRRQGLARLEQELSTRRARIAVAQSELERVRTEFDLQMADIASARAELAGEAAGDEIAGSVTVAAARPGVVTGIVVQNGDAIAENQHLLSILPSGGRLLARLEVPPETAGFIAPGQTVRLAVDAFPYQTFGVVQARIDWVSRATVPVTRADGSTDEVFLVQATLAANAMRAFEREQPLRPGMTVSARVKTRSRSFAEWVLEPLYAMEHR